MDREQHSKAKVHKVAWETWVLAGICIADMLSTMYLVRAGKAVEANPLLIPALNRGLGWFLFVKSIYFVIPLAALEFLRTHRPRFVRLMLRAGIAGYMLIYIVGGIRLNQSNQQLHSQIISQSQPVSK